MEVYDEEFLIVQTSVCRLAIIAKALMELNDVLVHKFLTVMAKDVDKWWQITRTWLIESDIDDEGLVPWEVNDPKLRLLPVESEEDRESFINRFLEVLFIDIADDQLCTCLM